jgi:hypothetical protein
LEDPGQLRGSGGAEEGASFTIDEGSPENEARGIIGSGGEFTDRTPVTERVRLLDDDGEIGVVGAEGDFELASNEADRTGREVEFGMDGGIGGVEIGGAGEEDGSGALEGLDDLSMEEVAGSEVRAEGCEELMDARARGRGSGRS